MRRPFVRLKIKSIMIAVAIAAMALGLTVSVQRRNERCLRLAVDHHEQAEFWAGEAWKNATCMLGGLGIQHPGSEQQIVEEHTRAYGLDAGLALKQVFQHRHLSDTYERAWMSPWTTFVFDPFGP
jgi:hypothetical protein